ncbi:MAG: hypothetical protein ACOZDY_03160 [Pseudomonadota bacterium]
MAGMLVLKAAARADSAVKCCERISFGSQNAAAADSKEEHQTQAWLSG